jgi:capsular polysaccharide biosynthesis protein
VRNQVDLAQEPEQVFLNPWQDDSVTLLAKPPYFWRAVPAALIDGVGASANPAWNDKIEGYLAQTRRHRKFKKAIMYSTVPAVIKDVGFRKSMIVAKDRILLSGAVGVRALTKFRRTNDKADFDPQQRVIEFFAACLKENKGKTLTVDPDALGPDIDFAIIARNTFNFYHFITETLSQLCVLDELDFQGRVFIHFPNREDKTRDFAKSFIDALFPELKDRVFFERAPKDYAQVLTAYDLVGVHYLNPELEPSKLNVLAPSDQFWNGQAATVAAQNMLQMNVVNSSLAALRDRGLRRIEGLDFSDLPKKFYVGRDTRQSRTRHMEGEDELFDHLRLFGFEYVVFENMHPLEQIALMANAEVMISYHGAGFTNMLFANPEAYVIEVGTLQTAMKRWGDFWPVANAARCKYISFFADYKGIKPGKEPNPFKDELLPAALSHQGIGQLMAFVVALDGHMPEMPKREDLLRLARTLYRSEEFAKTLTVLEGHPKLTAGHFGLQMLLADCYKSVDEPKSELKALDAAFKADKSRWQTLIRMIWCANRCERPQVIRWAVSRLQADFPERHDAFVENHDWVRYVV